MLNFQKYKQTQKKWKKKQHIFVKMAVLIVCLLFQLCFYQVSNIYAADATQSGETIPEAKTVRVGYYFTRDFQEGSESGHYKSGYGYEYLQRIASYTGWKYEYVYGDWQDLYQKLIDGKIDLMAGIVYSEERTKLINYPDYSMLNETFYIYKDIDDESIVGEDIASYSGKKIGTLSTDDKMTAALESWKAETGADIEIVYFNSLSECAADFNEKKIDGFVSADNVVSSYNGIIPVEKIGKEPYYLCTAKDRTDLLKELNNALAIISEQDTFDLEVLRNKYSAETAVNVFLSRQEYDWIETHDTIRVGYAENYLPYCDTDENGSVTGLVADLVPDLLTALPGEYQFDVTYQGFSSQTQMLESLKNGEVDIVFPVGDESWYAEEQEYLRSATAVVSPITLAYREPYNSETLTKIAVNKENLLQTSFTMENFPDAQIVLCDTIDGCMNAVRSGEANSTLVSALRSSYLVGEEKRLNTLTLSDDERLCFGVRFGDNALLQIINHGMTILGDSYGLNHTYRYMDAFATKYTVTQFVRDNIWAVVVCMLAIAVGAICFFVKREQSQKKAMEKEAEQNRQLEEALVGARQAAVARMVFLRNMSHDIRTPMNAVVGFTNLAIKSGSDSAKVQEYLNKILVSSNHLLGIVNDVLEISRIESGQTKLEESECCIDDIIKEADIIIREQAQEKQQSFVVDTFYVKNHYVVCDKLRIKEILVNLLGNSVKFTPAGGSISLTVSEPLSNEKDAWYEFVVKDTGCGMSQQFIQKIFEPFERDASATTKGIRGTGLGMPIVKSFVDMMGGTITIESEVGKGTTITVRLTLDICSAPKTQRPEQTENRQKKEPKDTLAGKRVLLAEDNELNREIALAVLEEVGLVVETAENGAEAVEKVKDAPEEYFVAILMDIQMPVMDGYTAAKTIRTLQGKRGSIPILAVSANAFNEDKTAAIEAGMNGHLPKPIDAERLLEVLRNLLNGNRK